MVTCQIDTCITATNMAQFLINVDLKPHTKFHENPIKSWENEPLETLPQ